MLDWLAANIANIVIIAVIVAAVVLAIRSIVRSRRAGRSSCGCDCSSCGMAARCHSDSKTTE